MYSKYVFILPVLLFGSTIAAQCLSGNCRDGQSMYKFQNGAVYTGNMLGGKFHGAGKLVYANGDVYSGFWKANRREGDGVLETNDGLRYEGKFVNNQLQGTVRVYDQLGGCYEGMWENGISKVSGTYTTQSGDKEPGSWEGKGFVPFRREEETISLDYMADCNLVPCSSGKGKMVLADGSVYTGSFQHGYPSGQGVCQYENGDLYSGRWKDGYPDGYGKYTYSSGLVLEGKWIQGKYVDMQPAAPTGSGQGANIYALLVGASRYDHFESLKYTDDDAYRMYAFLRSPEGGAVPDHHIRILIDESAVAENIYSGLDEIMAMAGSSDVVLVYLAGHGLQGYFVPTDSDGYRNRVGYEEIRERLSVCRARQKLVMADACYSGSLWAAKTPLFETVDLFYRKLNESGGGTAFLLSSKREEYSLESQGLRQGIFSHYLIEGLKGAADRDGDRLVTLEELYAFVYTHVREYSGNMQTPVLAGDIDRGMPLSSVR